MQKNTLEQWDFEESILQFSIIYQTLKFAEPHVPAIELVEQADAVIVWTDQ